MSSIAFHFTDFAVPNTMRVCSKPNSSPKATLNITYKLDITIYIAANLDFNPFFCT